MLGRSAKDFAVSDTGGGDGGGGDGGLGLTVHVARTLITL